MKKIAICVFGVNGVGKSALLGVVSKIYPQSIVARGSAILNEALGVASYESLESTSADVKKRAIIDGMSTLIGNAAKNSLVIVDTHLVVPIRTSGALTVEDMWDDRMLDIFHGFVYMSAHPVVISERRRIDSGRSLRILNSSLEACREDLRINASRWDEIKDRMPYKRVIVNDQSVFDGAKKILNFVDGIPCGSR